MTIMVKKEIEDPVITFAVENSVNDEEIADAYLRSLEMAQMMGGMVYRTVDLRAASNPVDVIKLIQNIVRELAGAAINPPMRINFVGSPAMVEAVSSMNVACFEDLDEALLHHKEMEETGIVAL
jgi:hypothetical protein